MALRMNRVPVRLGRVPTPIRAFSSINRCNQSAATNAGSTADAPIEPLPSRWLPELKSRIKKIQETSPAKADKANAVSQDIDNRWLDLIAGSEGFLTQPEWRGLDRREIIWGDIVGHVNNLVYNRLAESGRVNWVGHHSRGASPEEKQGWDELITPLSIGLILGSIQTIFKFPMNYPDRATVLYKLVGRPDYSSSSLELEAAVYSETHQRVAARCIESTVIYDYRAAKKTPLPGFMVEKFQQTYDRQVETSRYQYAQAQELSRAVEELEKN